MGTVDTNTVIKALTEAVAPLIPSVIETQSYDVDLNGRVIGIYKPATVADVPPPAMPIDDLRIASETIGSDGAVVWTLRYTVNPKYPRTYLWAKTADAQGTLMPWSYVNKNDTDGTIYFQPSLLPGATYEFALSNSAEASARISNITSPRVVPGGAPQPPEPVPTPTAKLTTLYGVSGSAPFVFHAHAIDAVSPRPDPKTTMYDWDFGDANPDAQYNRLTGWNAAHVYDIPGTYSVTCKITDAKGNVTVAGATVTVSKSTRSVVKLASIPDTISYSNTDVYLPVGKFSRTRKVKVIGTNLRIYGKDCTLNWDGPRDAYVALLDFDSTCKNVIVYGVSFDSKYSGMAREDKPVRGVRPAGKNVALIDCRFNELGDAINGENDPQGFFCLNMQCTDKIAGYTCWAEGSDWVVLGQVAPDSYVEHVDRVFVNRGNWSHCRIANPGATGNAYKGSFSTREAQNIWYADNTTGKGPLSNGPLEGTSYTTGPVMYYHNTFGDRFELWPGTRACGFIDNVMDVKGQSCVYVRKEAGRPVADVLLKGNTITGDTALMSGDTGALTWGTGNTYNGKPVAATG